MEEQFKITVDAQRAPVIEPGYTFGTVTEKISAIVLTRPASNGWFLGFGIAFMLTMMLLFRHWLSVCKRYWHLGREHPGGLGLRHRQLRVVDRDRPCRHSDLRHPLIAASVLAQFHQPLRRSHDAVRGRLRGVFPAIHIGRPWLAYWLFPYPNTMRVCRSSVAR